MKIMRCSRLNEQTSDPFLFMFPFTGFLSKTHSGAHTRLNISSTVQKTNRQKTKTIQELLKVPFQTEMKCRFNSITKWDENFMIYFLQSTMFFAVNNFYWQLFLAQLKMTFKKWIKYNSQDKCFLCVNQLVREKHWCTLCVQTLPSSGDWLTETSCGHFGIPLCGGAWFAMPAGEMDTPARHQQLHLADIRRGAVWLLLVEWVAVGWKAAASV